MLRKTDIETNPDEKYRWAMAGADAERKRILEALASMKKSGYINEPWFVIEREIINGTST